MFVLGVAQTHIGLSVCAPHKQKKGRTQGSPLHFYIIAFIHLPFYHLRYCAIGSDGVDTCGQVRDIYAVGIGGVGYFDAVDIVHTYGASGSREVEHVCHGVRVEGESLLGGGFGYVGMWCTALVCTCSSGYVGIVGVVTVPSSFLRWYLPCWWQGR